jgi:hypothetical protein
MEEGVPGVIYWFYYPGMSYDPHRDFLYILREPSIRWQTYSLGPVILEDRSYIHGAS